MGESGIVVRVAAALYFECLDFDDGRRADEHQLPAQVHLQPLGLRGAEALFQHRGAVETCLVCPERVISSAVRCVAGIVGRAVGGGAVPVRITVGG